MGHRLISILVLFVALALPGAAVAQPTAVGTGGAAASVDRDATALEKLVLKGVHVDGAVPQKNGGQAFTFKVATSALEDFDVTLTFCFTPESEGIRPHHTSPPRDPRPFAEFCQTQVRRYA